MRLFVMFVCLSLLLLGGCMASDSVRIVSSAGEYVVSVDVADTPQEQTLGLMFRESMDWNSGMLFVFDDMEPRGFWMKNTKIPLDIIFLNTDGDIVDMVTMEPCVADPCSVYTSAPAQYVLEINAGYSEQKGIVVGDSVKI